MRSFTEAQIREVWVRSEERCIYGERKPLQLDEYGITWFIEPAWPWDAENARDWRAICLTHRRGKHRQDLSRMEYLALIDAGRAPLFCAV